MVVHKVDLLRPEHGDISRFERHRRFGMGLGASLLQRAIFSVLRHSCWYPALSKTHVV
jgi:hypothetical protein